jgi:hypothetical protein
MAASSCMRPSKSRCCTRVAGPSRPQTARRCHQSPLPTPRAAPAARAGRLSARPEPQGAGTYHKARSPSHGVGHRQACRMSAPAAGTQACAPRHAEQLVCRTAFSWALTRPRWRMRAATHAPHTHAGACGRAPARTIWQSRSVCGATLAASSWLSLTSCTSRCRRRAAAAASTRARAAETRAGAHYIDDQQRPHSDVAALLHVCSACQRVVTRSETRRAVQTWMLFLSGFRRERASRGRTV